MNSSDTDPKAAPGTRSSVVPWFKAARSREQKMGYNLDYTLLTDDCVFSFKPSLGILNP